MEGHCQSILPAAAQGPRPYRGRLAPSPTGYLHLGHARTFWTAQIRARKAGGMLVLRVEDLDGPRCKPEFMEALFEDLRWFGFQWQEGPDVGGPWGPYRQSERRAFYERALERLQAGGWVYPCRCSRREVAAAARAPHAEDEDEPIYPGTCRPRADGVAPSPEGRFHWRFRVPDGDVIEFEDGCHGPQRFVAGQDFGDFIVWRSDGVPAYQLACVVDDACMQITEVVRGADLLRSTARQLLLYRALGWDPPRFYHCPLLTDASGRRLAKRHAALSLRTLRERGWRPEHLRALWAQPDAGLPLLLQAQGP
ncbi:tRNA glutamyl-Q(34) synthetase GluQRS [Limisphaera sp. VF-2]|jgi:glutamyl-queuosine tRNA(Asp) synthetase|uniref:tRNA glutamyl-Q(34) synthetase GluQRS n=1 Tax=Limisphaera sp. VF-2 TaxID=3400418 RepID=UPI0017529EC0